jgi:hypothetical protein
MRVPNRVTIGTGAAVALLVCSGGAWAEAASASGAAPRSPIDANGVIHGCWSSAEVDGSHVLVLQNAGSSCPKGTIAISWSQGGSSGPTGATGTAGAKGLTGANGATGASGAAGVTGATGPSGPQGAPGATGASGPGGVTGATGPSGPQGASGATGASGSNGSAGATGGEGPTGHSGPEGRQGPTGPAGSSSGAGNLDALNGTPCDVGTNGEGTLSVTYTPNDENATDAVSIVCNQHNPNQQFALNVNLRSDTSERICEGGAFGEECHGGNPGQMTVTSSPEGINCHAGGGPCAGDFTGGTKVTLTASPASDNRFEGWFGCESTTEFTCTVTVNAVRTVSAAVEGPR